MDSTEEKNSTGEKRKQTDTASTSCQPPSPKRAKEDLGARTLLVSDLKMHSQKSKIYDYFEGVLKETVESISFNYFPNRYYNNSCLVVMDSIRAARRVMRRPSREHVIDDCRVTVQYFRGKENHPQVFQVGEHQMLVERLNELYYSHKLIEDLIVKNGSYSNITWTRDKYGNVDGDAIISFNEENDREKARDVILRKLTHRVLLPQPQPLNDNQNGED